MALRLSCAARSLQAVARTASAQRQHLRLPRPIPSSRLSTSYQSSRHINMASLSSTATTSTTTTTSEPSSKQQPPPPKMGTKREGDISDAFFSLSHDGPRPPLPDRYRELKKSLVAGHEARVIESWNRLLDELKQEIAVVAELGPRVVPSIDFANLDTDMKKFRGELQKRGVAVIRGVVPEDEARAYKFQLEDYVRQNPSTKAFPQNDPQVYELYWSSPQLRARSHPNLLRASKALMDLWHSSDPNSTISLTQPMSYADRLRIRQPGDASFALGPHIDGGSVERWEKHGYGVGGVYDAIFEGRWGSDNDAAAAAAVLQKNEGTRAYDPWDISGRVDAVMNNYDGLGACSAFRMFQGWLSMSHTRPREGTLMVNPMLRHAMAYVLLRPFFEPVRNSVGGSREEFLSRDNWRFVPQDEMNSDLQGASMGSGQELTEELHPHLELDKSMVHVPEIRPGDFVVWHCDTIHAVDKVHMGKSDSSVLYIPVCPTTERNAEYLLRQRDAFLQGTPGPDFPGGKGESEHIGRPTVELLHKVAGEEGLRAFGFQKLVPQGEKTTADVGGVGMAKMNDDESEGARRAIEGANRILGF